MTREDARDERALEASWEALAEGRALDALRLLEEVGEDVAERWVHAAHAWLDLGERGRAAKALERLREAWGAEDEEVLWLTALFHLARGEPTEALAALDAVRTRDPVRRAEVHEQRSVALDLLGDARAALRELRRAHRVDPAAHPPPLALSARDFDRALAAAVDALPGDFARYLEEIPVVVDPMPSLAIVREGTAPDVLGLWDPGDELAPARILVFQRNLERAFPDRAELAREIETTLYHELGHALGFDEHGVGEMGLG